MQVPQGPSTRRRFLVRSLAASLATAAAPSFLRRAHGADAPSNKLNIAAIGVGGQGGGDLGQMATENIVALCDVDSRRAADTFRRFPKARQFQDFRRMFDTMGGEIDAVLVATPDHVHAVAAIHAMRLGKHVFCEKPLAHSILEAREMVRVAHETRVTTQMGNQGHAESSIRVFREWIEDGVIGPVREIHAMCSSVYSQIQMLGQVKQGEPVPAELNWDLWLGPAAYRPYHSAYLPGNWRSWSAFGTGVIGDWTCHVVDPVFWALNLGAPSTIEAKTGAYNPLVHGETFPLASEVHFEFPARGSRPAVKLVWHDGASVPPRPAELAKDEKLPGIGALVIGDKGKMTYGSHGASRPTVLDPDLMESLPKQPQRLARSIGHYKEWIEACKTGKPTGSPFEYGGPLAEIALLGVIAIRCQGEKLQWDAPAMRFTNSKRANQMVEPVFRKGWKL